MRRFIKSANFRHQGTKILSTLWCKRTVIVKIWVPHDLTAQVERATNCDAHCISATNVALFVALKARKCGTSTFDPIVSQAKLEYNKIEKFSFSFRFHIICLAAIAALYVTMSVCPSQTSFDNRFKSQNPVDVSHSSM